MDVLALAVLGGANGSQSYLDLRIRKDGRWKLNGFEIITAVDTAFAVLDFASIAALLTAGSV